MLKAYRTEIHPTPDQSQQIVRTFGVCRYLYNLYIATNQARYQQGLPFLSAYDFDQWINREYALEYPWIKAVSSKARKKAIVNAATAYRRFFKGLGGHPRFKKKHQQSASFYAPKNNAGDWTIERHRIKIPTLGWVRLKEFGYLPVGSRVTGGTITQQADRFFVSVTVKAGPPAMAEPPSGEGIGVDVGIKEFATTSQGDVFPNINQTAKIQKLERRLRLAQRAGSRKFEERKRQGLPVHGGKNLAKNRLRIQKLSWRLANQRRAYRETVIQALVKTKPRFITVEHLNIRGMLKNRHLSKAIQDQGFYAFKQRLVQAANQHGIEIREVGMFYPSSKRCSRCGSKKLDLTLKDRIYDCPQCGLSIDRDLNAANNLAQAKEYKILH
jgi:putative transposase